MLPPRPLLTLLAAVGVALAAPSSGRADSNLQTELAEVAKDVKSLLRGRGDTSVAVGQFVSTGDVPATAGPAFARGLTEELKLAGVPVVASVADVKVSGEFRPVVDDVSESVAVELKLAFADRHGTPFGDLRVRPRGIFGDSAVAIVCGLTVDLPPTDPAARTERLKVAADRPPPPAVAKTVLRSAADSPYGIELLVKAGTDFTPRRLTVANALAFAELRRDEVYGVRLVNDSDHDAAVKLAVDGLSMFVVSDAKHPATGKPAYEHLLVPKRSSFLVRGWHRSNDVTEEFKITEYAKSVAAEVQSCAATGTVTATFAAAWPENGNPPADEPLLPNRFAKSANDATGRGNAVGETYREERRHVGVVRAAVSVRYHR